MEEKPDCYIDPSLRDVDRYKEIMDEEVKKVRDKFPNIQSIHYQLGHSIRHYNPFCTFRVVYGLNENESVMGSFFVELHENDTDRSVEILKRAFNNMREEKV